MPEEDISSPKPSAEAAHHHSEVKSVIAENKPRDEEGHFIHVEPPKDPETPLSPKEKVAKYFGAHIKRSEDPEKITFRGTTTIHSNQDDILDVHVGNPLHKIVDLLQEIKQQKAFSFTLKGSLGIAGVALALGMFGILGAGNLLCEKGVQKEIGVIKVLNVQEEEPATIPLISGLIDYFSPRQTHNSTVLIKSDETIITIPYSKNVNISQYQNLPVVATGDYDACGQKLKITDQDAVEIYVKTPW